ncbi:MAG: STAS domain-containing protein [Alphaproteobacteria bacterium]|nr:STAS domain-containing protein [Alphaproteobacteria bacterium]
MEFENKTLNIEQTNTNGVLVCKLTGWLDPNTTPKLEEEINLAGVKELVFDMQNVEYVFSAGLRAFLYFEKMMKASGGTMKLINVSDFIKSIFEMVGFQEIIENTK